MLGYNDIITNIKTVGEQTEYTFEIIAAGGTSLVLHDIKKITHDVDFIIEKGYPIQFSSDYQEYCHTDKIDVSLPAECFGTALPGDYLDHTMYVGEFGKVKLYSLSIVDTIITKASRSIDRDIADIELCVDKTNIDTLLNRLNDYYTSKREKITNTIKDVFE